MYFKQNSTKLSDISITKSITIIMFNNGVVGGGGVKNGRGGGHVKFYPYEKGGGKL